jgi:hypothetical protein
MKTCTFQQQRWICEQRETLKNLYLNSETDRQSSHSSALIKSALVEEYMRPRIFEISEVKYIDVRQVSSFKLDTYAFSSQTENINRLGRIRRRQI